MIFSALAALVIALVLLIIAVVKSSVAWGVGALVLSVLGSALLLAAYSVYRQRFGADVAPDLTLTPAVAPAGATWVAPAAAPPPVGGPPVDGYPDLTGAQAAKVAETLNLDELHAMRRYEVEHANRAAVLQAVDRRIDQVVAVRRQLRVS